MKIIVDAFGGDHAPLAVIEGCRQAVDELGAEILLTGDEEKIRQAAAEAKISLDGMEIVHAPSVIPVEEDPTTLLKKYADSSMAVGLRLLSEGKGEAFVSAGKPVLGICKGIQLINVAFGGTLIQDLSAESLAIHAWAETDKIHISKAAPGTFPAQLYGSAPRVNSAHHQAVGTVGDGLRIAQYGPDFVVEALYHERLPIIGVQWHPERMCFSYAREDMADGSHLLSYFLSL